MRLLGFATVGVLALVGATVWFRVMGHEAAGMAQPTIAPKASRSGPERPTQAMKATAASAGASTTAERGDADESLQARIANLREAENWNVLVLYANDWTRKEPNNVNAWIQLSVGYNNLRQFGEAFETAAKAVQAAPGDPQAWRNLGYSNLPLGQTEDALRAFEQAVALNRRDVPSLVQVGRLNAQLGRLPQAKAAFDKALLASPNDSDALCGQAFVARQQGRSKDADAIASMLQGLGRPCRETQEGESVTVVPMHSMAAIQPRTATDRPGSRAAKR